MAVVGVAPFPVLIAVEDGLFAVPLIAVGARVELVPREAAEVLIDSIMTAEVEAPLTACASATIEKRADFA